MTDDTGPGKQHKHGRITKSSKRSKFTLSLNSNSSIRSSGNCESGRIHSGTLLHDGLRKPSTGNAIKSSIQNGNSGTISCGTGLKELSAADLNDEVVSIESYSVELEGTTRTGCSSSTSNGPQVENRREKNLKKLSQKDLRNCSKNDVTEHLLVRSLHNEDLCDLNGSFLQAKRHTITSTPPRPISKTVGNSNSPELADCKETSRNVETERKDGAGKVESWLCNQSVSVRDEGSGAEDREQSGSETEQRATSKLFEEGRRESDVRQCPVCWKTLDRKVSAHLKLCAAKHKVSTQQLLEALEMQSRQARERQALGLPVVEVSRKQSAPRKGQSGGDAGLQLALALSASMQEAEEREQDALLESCVVAEPTSLSPGVVQRQLSLLEKYGFTNSRPARPCARYKTSVSKATLKNYPLLSRTCEARERLITEKVAIVLMGEEDVRPASPDSPADVWQDGTQVSSHLLLGLQHTENQLWEMAGDISADVSKEVYYVDSLASHISPSKLEPGAKLKHLSQIQGRINTPKRPQDSQKKEQDNCPDASSEEKAHSQFVEERLRNVKKLLDFSAVVHKSSRPERRSAKKHQQVVAHSGSLAADWASVLNKQAMSDVTIHVCNGREIPAHKLVFYARCPAILYDLIREEHEGKVHELLMWLDVSYKTALAFLEFLYCGTTQRILHLGDDVSGVKNLAHKYQVMEVVDHVQVMHKVRTLKCSGEGSSSDITRTSARKTDALRNPSNENCLLSKRTACVQSRDFEIDNAPSTEILKNDISVCQDRLESRCSPVMLYDECSTEERLSQDSRTSVDCLLSLLNKGNASSTDVTDEVNLTCCDSQVPNGSFSKNKLRINQSVGSCGKVFQQGGLFDTGKNIADNKESMLNEAVSGNVCSETKDNVTEKNIPIQDSPKKCSVRSILDVNLTQLPTMDITQDSSDEDVTKNMATVNEKSDGKIMSIDLTTAGSESTSTDHAESPNSAVVHKNSQSSQVGHEASSEPNIDFVDNVWDDFDDAGVVPNLSFYSSFTCDREVLGSKTHRSGEVASSPNTEPRPGSSSSRSSSDERRRKVGTGTEARSMEAEVASTLLHGGEESPCERTPQGSVRGSPRKTDCSYKNLLEDSLVDALNSSALWRGESPHAAGREVLACETAGADSVTPLPNYSTMKTPLLKKELSRYGLKPLNRNQAKQILRHIYNEMHPVVGRKELGRGSLPAYPSGHPPGKSLFKEPRSRSASASPSPKKCVGGPLSQARISSSASRGSCTAEGTIPETDIISQADTSTSQTGSVDFRQAVRQYIKSAPELYERILRYEPVWLEELQAGLKAQKLKFNVNQLIDFLDEQCIVFRTARGQQNRARRKRKRKSTSSLSQPSRGRPRKKCARSLSDDDFV